MILQLEGLLVQLWLVLVCILLEQEKMLASITLLHWWTGVAFHLLLVSMGFALQDIQFFPIFINLWLTKKILRRQCSYGMIHNFLFQWQPRFFRKGLWSWSRLQDQGCWCLCDCYWVHISHIWAWYCAILKILTRPLPRLQLKTLIPTLFFFSVLFIHLIHFIFVQFCFADVFIWRRWSRGISYVWRKDFVSDNIGSTTRCICFQSLLVDYSKKILGSLCIIFV